MNRVYDVVIVGAGIAGLRLAQLLGGLKLRVGLLDGKSDLSRASFPTLGSFLEPAEHGLSERWSRPGSAKSVSIPGTSIPQEGPGPGPRQEAALRGDPGPDRPGAGRHPSLHARAGAVIGPGWGRGLGRRSERGPLRREDLRGRLRHRGFFSRKLGLLEKRSDFASGLEYNVAYDGPQAQAHLFTGKACRGGYAWLFPFGAGRAIFGFGSFEPSVRAQLRARLDALFAEPLLKKLIRKDDERLGGGNIPVTDVKTRFVSRNVVGIGDCVSQANPLVGEGHKFILESALLLAPRLQQAIACGGLAPLQAYEQDWKKRFEAGFRHAKRRQVLAGKVSGSDFLSDIAALCLAAKSDKAFMRSLSGELAEK